MKLKKLLLTILATINLYAEASFDQVQTMIDKQDYKQAKLALTVITQNHPNSAKAFYSLAQANAGLGDLIAAQSALEKAQALNPTLNFVPKSQVEQLKQAIQPQSKLITKVEEPSNWFRNLILATIIGALVVFGYRRFNKPKPIKEEPTTKYDSPKPEPTRSYEKPTSSPSTLETIAVAGIASAAVSSMMNNYESSTLVEPTHSSSWDSKPTHSYQPERISSTWDEPDNSWDEPTPSKSNSWSDSSWSDSSSSSNSSWSE